MENATMYRLTQRPGAIGLQCDRTGLALAGVPLLRRNSGRFVPRSPNEIRVLLTRAYQSGLDWDDHLPGINAVAKALNDGDLVRAMIAAVMLKLPELDWNAAARLADAEDILTKGGFNPNEPRDERGRWTDGSAQTSDTAGPSSDPPFPDPAGWDPDDVIDIAYQGKYHDIIVKHLVRHLRGLGCTVVTEVPLTGINGVTARADFLARSADGSLLVLIDVKTGRNPGLTPSQRSVYPLAAIGGHVTSFDPKVAKLGLIPGRPFPPMRVFTTYKRGPGFPFLTDEVIPEFLP